MNKFIMELLIIPYGNNGLFLFDLKKDGVSVFHKTTVSMVDFESTLETINDLLSTYAIEHVCTDPLY